MPSVAQKENKRGKNRNRNAILGEVSNALYLSFIYNVMCLFFLQHESPLIKRPNQIRRYHVHAHKREFMVVLHNIYIRIVVFDMM